LFATSMVGARMPISPDCRQFNSSAVSMIPAASVLLPFFFEISSRNSRISRLPVSGSYAPKIAPPGRESTAG
jgi:hypothetical protein